MASRVLIVEDEPDIRDLLAFHLGRAGYHVAKSRTGADALRQIAASPPDLVLLDLMLPKRSGIDVCRELRARSNVPIIIVTARDAEVDAVVGLEVGADDYVTKPYRMRELVARIRAALRRAPDVDVEPAGAVIEVADVRLDVDRHDVRVRGREVQFPRKEFELLSALLERAGRVVTRETLISEVWGPDYVGDTKTLDVHVKRLRSKIEEDPTNPTRITTIRGVGYRYERPKAITERDASSPEEETS